MTLARLVVVALVAVAFTMGRVSSGPSASASTGAMTQLRVGTTYYGAGAGVICSYSRQAVVQLLCGPADGGDGLYSVMDRKRIRVIRFVGTSPTTVYGHSR